MFKRLDIERKACAGDFWHTDGGETKGVSHGSKRVNSILCCVFLCVFWQMVSWIEWEIMERKRCGEVNLG